MKTLIKNNSLYYFFIITQILVVLLGIQDDYTIGNNVKYGNAVLYHFAGLIFFTVGYLPLSKKTFIDEKLIVKKNLSINKSFYLYGYILSIVGLITSVATIGSIISPIVYLQILFSGGSDLLQIKYDSGTTGLTGFFKMMNYFPLGVFLVSNSFTTFYHLSEKDNKKMKKLILFATLGCVVKVFFSLDRLTLLAMILVFFYKNFLEKKVKIQYIVYIMLIIFLLGFITASRMGGSGIVEFLVTYFKLSIVNYELIIDTHQDFTYGFNSFLMPFWYILKFFGIDYEIPSPEHWIWNPAQYFASYLYMDFGVFSMLVFLLIGVVVRKIQLKTSYGNLYYSSIYFIILFALITFISVPIIRAIEFWLMLTLALFMSKNVKIENS